MLLGNWWLKEKRNYGLYSKYGWSCMAKWNGPNLTSGQLQALFSPRLGDHTYCHIDLLFCVNSPNHSNSKADFSLLSTNAVYWINLKKENKLNHTTTHKQPRSQHCCQKMQSPFSVYGKLMRLKFSSVAGCVMGRENYFSSWICFLNCTTAQTENQGWESPLTSKLGRICYFNSPMN